MIRKILVTALGVAVAAGIAVTPSTTAVATTGHHYVRPAGVVHHTLPRRRFGAYIFFSPHEDDETLSGGMGIISALDSGRPTYVVFMTDGGSSGVLPWLCLHKSICLTRAQFSAAREQEARNAVSVMGVPADHVFFENQPDNGMTQAAANAIVHKYAARFGGPGDTLATVTPVSTESDHRYTAHAVAITPAGEHRFYLTPGQDPRKFWVVEEDRAEPINDDFQRFTRAAAQYNDWDPEAGQYAIGFTSVRHLWTVLAANPTSYATR